MDYEKGAELMMDALKGFHGRFKLLYGQMALRLDDETYLLSGGNKLLAGAGDEDFAMCDIRTGGLGELFGMRPDIDAILFGVTKDMVAVSERGVQLRTTLVDIAEITGSELRISPDASPENIAEALEGSTVCLIKGMGGLACGSNLKKAVAGIQIIEKACEAESHGVLLGGTVPLDADYAESCRDFFQSDYVHRNEKEKIPFVGFDEEEFSLRVRLIEAGKDLVKKDLTYGSWGSLSVRCGADEMLITPSAMDYFEIRPEDIVRMNINELIFGEQRVPSGESAMHAAVYRQLPDCEAVIHVHSNALSVFSACEAGFASGDPDLKELIGDVLVTANGRPVTPEVAVSVAETMTKTHAAVIPHHGAVFTGPSVETAVSIAEAVELRARSILDFDSDIVAEEDSE